VRQVQHHYHIDRHTGHANAMRQPCDAPASGFPVPNVVITLAVDRDRDPVNKLPQRCVVNGYVNRHISPVDQCQYADGFAVNLPANWNGRFMFQDPGGIGGTLVPAVGETNASIFFGM
jgi:feruloyl esterase